MKGRSGQKQGGYRLDDLGAVFGETTAKVRAWVRKGLFGRCIVQTGDLRISEPAVIRFIREHAAEYRLARVDQDRFRALIFAELPARRRKTGGAL